MTRFSPNTYPRSRPPSNRIPTATCIRWIRVLAFVGLIAAFAGALLATPAVAQSEPANGSGDSGGSLGPGTLCNSVAGDFLAKAMWLMTFGGLMVGIVMWQYTSTMRMFGKRSAEEAAQREAAIKSSMVKLVAIPIVALIAAQVFGIPVIQCMLADLPFL